MKNIKFFEKFFEIEQFYYALRPMYFWSKKNLKLQS